MDTKSSASAALFISLNLLFFLLVAAHDTPCKCNPPHKPKHTPPPKPTPCPPPPSPKPHPPPKPITPPSPKPTPPSPKPITPPSPKPITPPSPIPITPPSPIPITPPSPEPTPEPTPSPGSSGKCPIDTLKLGVCGDLLGLVTIIVGSPSSRSCCSLIEGLTDLDAAVCLCTALKANVLGINLNIPISLSLLLNACEKSNPSGYQCA